MPVEHRAQFAKIQGPTGLAHFTDQSGWCWCLPEVFRICPECDGAPEGCWECEGTGLLWIMGERVEDYANQPLIVVHRNR